MDGQSLSKQASKQARVEYIDLFRAFGIILMIMGHVIFGGFFSKWIHAFHMPMFFFISGWFYKTNDLTIRKSILRKARSLLVPYFCFEAIVWVLSLPLTPEYLNTLTLYYALFENTFAIPVTVCNNLVSPIPGAMWFLTAIFFTEFIYIVLDKILGYNWKMHISVTIIAVLGMIAPKLLPFRLPWALDAAFVGTGFFHLARAMKGSRAERILHLKLWQALLMGILFSALIMVCPRINMRTGKYGVYIPFWFNAMGAIIAGWNLARHAEGFLLRGKLGMVVATWLKGIGRNSIVYLCLNQIVILDLMWVLTLIGIKGFIVKIPILIFTMLILLAFEKLICGTKLKVIIGK